MGVMNAMLTAVTGLSAQSYALENISGNIANSQTVGFKRVNTSFVDMIPESAAGHEVAGSVSAYSSLTNTIQGSTQTTGISTNMALNGNGWFVVQKNTGSVATPTFSGTDIYTRRGDFTPDANGYLVNGAGNYLVGTTATGSQGPLKIDTSPVPAKTTATLNYTANLPALPKTAAYSATTANSELLSSSLAGSTTISGSDKADFENQSIPGGDVTVYDSKGNALTLRTRWAKTASTSSGGTDTWKLYYQNDASATGTSAAYTQVGGDVTFDSSGKMTSASSATIASLTINGTAIGPVTLSYGSSQLTQYGDANGQISNGDIKQDGYSTGLLTSVAVTSDGQLSGTYSNGKVQTIGTVAVAHFKSDDQLKRLDGGTYGQTIASGTPTYGMQGSTVSSGAVEMSNTDIAEEFSKMIVTQQAYSANTRVITTAQKMLEDVINVIR